MKRALSLAAALVCGLVVTAGTQGSASPKPITEGTPVTLVGEIKSQPRNAGIVHEHKMQVAVGPSRVDHTLHMDDARIFNDNGKEMAVSDLRDRMWVEAEGTVMSDPRRIKVTRLVVFPSRERFERSAYFRPGLESGYVETVAGSREVFTSTKPFETGERVVLVGRVISQPKNAGIVHEHKMQVAVGPRGEKESYTLHLKDAQMFGVNGQEMHASDFRDRMWVRAEGRVMEDARRVQVDRLQVIASDRPGYTQSRYFHSDEPAGYIIRADADSNR